MMLSSVQGKLSVERMCTLAQVSRAGFYRWLKTKEPAAEETAVRSAIQEIAVQHRRCYGYRRITAQLRQRGMVVNRKRVLRMMQEDNLLAIRTRNWKPGSGRAAFHLKNASRIVCRSFSKNRFGS